MPDVRNCKGCRKIFSYQGGIQLCNECKQKDEEGFKKIREYLYKNPKASMSEVSEAVEISVEKITRYLKEGRLEIVGDGGNFFLSCESCGKSIKSGRFCDLCSSSLQNSLQDTAKSISDKIAQDAEEEASVQQRGMRYLHKEDKNKRY